MLLYGKYMLFKDEIFDFDGNSKKYNEITRADVEEVVRLTFGGVKAVGAVGNLNEPFPL